MNNIKLYIILIICLIFFWGCDDEEHKGGFKYTLDAQNILLISCDNACLECTDSRLGLLDREEYSGVYDKCEGLPDGHIDPPILALVEFKPPSDADNLWGFDHWRDDKTNYKEESYMSIGAGSSNTFLLTITLDGAGNSSNPPFSQYRVKIEDDGLLRLKFQNGSDEMLFDRAVKNFAMTVSAEYSSRDGDAEIKVYGVPASGGDDIPISSLREDALKIIVYKQKKIDMSLYYSQDEFDYENSNIQEYSNSVLKQASFLIEEINDYESKWLDFNEDGYCDRFFAYPLFSKLRPVEFYDEFELTILTAGQEDLCALNNERASFIVSNIRMHTVMLEDPVADENGKLRYLKVHGNPFGIGTEITISSFTDAFTDKLTAIIEDYDKDTQILTINNNTKGVGIPFDSRVTTANRISIYSNGTIRGEACESCAFSIDNNETFVHEMGHLEKNGYLRHPGEVGTLREVDNLMYSPGDLREGTQLRYRKIDLIIKEEQEKKGPQSQWETLQNAH